MRKLLLLGLITAGLVGNACSAAISGAEFKEGVQYVPVPQKVAPDDRNVVRVQEFFWYGCPHCYRLDPLIDAWAAKLPKDVVFERVPNTLGRPIGQVHQRAFYIAEVLGVLGKTHTPLFDAIHRDGLPMGNLGDIRSLYVRVAGITAQQFDDASSSFVVDADMRRADQLAQDYGILSVPTVVVGGEYVTDGEKAGSGIKGISEKQSFERMLKVASFLIDKVRAQRGLH
ncbi:MAG: thiol:disulfide interchange protein DsbA/DsbL [Gammaproteobacteria bacterium]|nr:thiol:disulfide interchange protein DsbA/DsbL [Gammaproteobacteria bacterium]